MKVTVSNLIIIDEPTKEIKDYCKKELTFANPDYQKKRVMGYSLWNTPKTIKLYEIYDNKYYLPIGCFNDLFNMYPNPTIFTDITVSRPIKIESSINLRVYQKPCLNALKSGYTGLFILPAGTGKTITALQCVYYLKQKTLWLTHTIDLLNQAKNECEKNMNCKTSTITQGKCDYSGDIVFATVQTLVNIIDNGSIPQDTFGLVIADEVQHCIVSAESVMQFQKCMAYFASRYKLGLTATLHTANNLHVTIPKLIGSILYELKKVSDKFIGYSYYKGEVEKECEVDASLFQVPAKIHFIKTNYSVIGKTNIFENNNQTVSFSKLITDIADDEERNAIIIKLLNSLDKPTIVVSDRTSQLKYLYEKFSKNAVYVDGKTKKSDRDVALEQVRLGNIKYLFATYKLICEGFNAPILENIVMATPIKDLRIVIQSIGRVQRPYKDKKIANVYDIVDDVAKLDNFVKARKKIYKKENYKMED